MNDKYRILVLGSSGLIGIPLVSSLLEFHKVFTTYYKNKYCDKDIHVDILNKKSLEQVFDTTKPEIIINLCGIYKNLQFCDENKNLVMAVNGESLKYISKLSNKYNSYLVSLSSDFVFDGQNGDYKEDDVPYPESYYGKTRLVGEKYIQEIAKKYCIVRTSMIYGKNSLRTTLSDLIYSNVKNGNSLKLIDDQIMTPTYLNNFCLMLKEILEKQYEGIIHLAGPEKLSRYQFGIKLVNQMNLSNELLIPVSKNEFDFGNKLPNNSSLNTNKASSFLNEKPESVEKSLKHYCNSMEKIKS